jgi:hypothetical protein
MMDRWQFTYAGVVALGLLICVSCLSSRITVNSDRLDKLESQQEAQCDTPK